MTEPRLGCVICHKIRKTERGMYNHLKKEHADIISCHLNIIISFACEEGSEQWKRFIAPLIASNKSEAKPE